jgi:hypothetical protein
MLLSLAADQPGARSTNTDHLDFDGNGSGMAAPSFRGSDAP